MLEIKKDYYLWIFSVLIIVQSLWVSFRMPVLEEQRTPQQLPQQAVKETSDIHEKDIQEKLPQGGRLRIEPSEARFAKQFSLGFYAETDQPLKKVDLKIFYPSDLLQVLSSDVQVNEKIGLIEYSKQLTGKEENEFLVKEIYFLPISTGSAEIEFDFNKQSLLDSNLISMEGTDILEEIQGANIILNK